MARIIFTNGCFDFIHKGHIYLLKEAKKLGDILIVGLNSDDSVKRLKGSERPINNEKQRIVALESLPFVDQIFVFEEDTPIELIKIIKPDIIVKGSDYKKEDVVGYDFVKERGGDVVIIPLFGDYSTTKIIERIF